MIALCGLLGGGASLSVADAAPPRAASSRGATDRELALDGRAIRPVGAGQGIPSSLVGLVVPLAVDRGALASFAAGGGGVLERVPLGAGIELDLVLAPFAPFAADGGLVLVDRDGERPIAHTGVHLVGTVRGVADSTAHLSATDAGVFGLVEVGDRRHVLTSGPYGAGLPTVAYEMGSLPEGTFAPPAWTCESPEPPLVAGGDGGVAGSSEGEGGVAGGSDCRQVRIAWETDEEFLGLFGGNASAATGYVATLATNLSTIYARDVNARLNVQYLRLWTAGTDPWSGTSTSAQLNQFLSYWQANMGTVQRDAAHFLSGRGLGGGVAYLGALCGSAGYGVSANLAGSYPSPLVDNSGQNWDPYVVAHELGHNFGAPHTHSETPPADGCGLSPQDCAVANADEGTIMSYCHLCAGGVQNIQLRFHPASIGSMQSYLSGLGCSITGAARPPVTVPDRVSTPAGSELLIDVLANEIAFNCEPIAIDSFVQGVYGGVVERRVGAGPDGRDLLAYRMPNASFNGEDIFTYRVIDTSGQLWTGAVYVTVAPVRQPENPVGAEPEIAVAYYALPQLSALPDFDTLEPYATDLAPTVNFASTNGNFATSGLANDVGAVFEGWLDVPTTGTWTLFTTSDDGSRLLVGSTEVVSNDGLHGMQERSGTIALGAGRHALRIEFFERGGGAGLIAQWQGPGVAKAPIPAAALSHGGAVEPADLDRNGFVDGADLAILLSAWGQSGSAGDINRDGQIDGQDLAILLSAWTN